MQWIREGGREGKWGRGRQWERDRQWKRECGAARKWERKIMGETVREREKKKGGSERDCYVG